MEGKGKIQATQEANSLWSGQSIIQGVRWGVAVGLQGGWQGHMVWELKEGLCEAGMGMECRWNGGRCWNEGAGGLDHVLYGQRMRQGAGARSKRRYGWVGYWWVV